MLDTPTKAMVIGASAAIMLAAGTYLAKEYRSLSRESSAVSAKNEAKQELFRMANTSVGDEAAARDFCRVADTASQMDGDTKQEWQRIVRNCRALGYL